MTDIKEGGTETETAFGWRQFPNFHGAQQILQLANIIVKIFSLRLMLQFSSCIFSFIYHGNFVQVCPRKVYDDTARQFSAFGPCPEEILFYCSCKPV
jgi:hypothetical protein